MESDVINTLLASHSLTGCAKVGGKTSMLQALQNHSELIINFGKEELDENAILAAIKFFVKVVALKRFQNCPLGSRHILRQHPRGRGFSNADRC